MRGLPLAGHSLHPALVHFPIAFWMASLATEGAVLATGAAFWRLAAWWLLVARSWAICNTASFTYKANRFFLFLFLLFSPFPFLWSYRH